MDLLQFPSFLSFDSIYLFVCLFIQPVLRTCYVLGTGYRLPKWLSGKESTYQYRRHRFNSWVRKIHWRRKWQPTPVLLPEKSHGQRSMAGYCPWGCKESNVTEHTHMPYMHFSFGQCYFLWLSVWVLYLENYVLSWNFVPLHMFLRLTKPFLKFIWETTAHVSG